MDIDALALQLGFKRRDTDVLIDIFIKSISTLLKEMHIMIQEKSMQGIADAAHAIKVSAGNLKLKDISKLSKRIEIMATTKSNEDYEILYAQLKKMIDELNT